ncbi:MAG TPA: 5-(carboxyamino)imidazole ribonucleotide synthase [Streptosporangiaceae bacterium]|nr:5-(carboxyamino)imidazole ribonucleotide synthase [Streptosporangiaceae bacterium]
MDPPDFSGAPRVGMVGGGQLARMTCQAAIALGARFRVLAASTTDSAALVWAGTSVGDYRDEATLREFAADCDVLTFDHEHVPGDLLRKLDGLAEVRPGPDALRYTQDKLTMRDRLTDMGIRCPRYAPVRSVRDVRRFGYPVVLKAVTGGYDGRGVWVCLDEAAAVAVLDYGVALLAEELVPFRRELAVVAARSPHKQGAVYPVVETVQVDGICREVIAPAPGLDSEQAQRAQALALRIASELDVAGLLAVELFETADGLLVNELAMRPHNTGHWTIDGARTSQFEQHLRAVLDLPLGSTTMTAPVAVMANVLGGTGDEWEIFDRYIHVMAADPDVKIHMYGKEPRPGRKIGHVTVRGADVADVRERARRAASYLRWGREDGQ